MSSKHQHESRIHISKRDDMPLSKACAIKAIGIVLALIVCTVIIMLLTKFNPLEVYSIMIEGAFGATPLHIFSDNPGV